MTVGDPGLETEMETTDFRLDQARERGTHVNIADDHLL